jgi:TM2 domain-containing membrane protein YozV
MSDSASMMKYDANKKSKGMAYVLCIFFGSLGAHRFYLDRKGTASIILINTILSFILMITFIGFFTIMISSIWVFIDLFLIPGYVQKYNNQLALKLDEENVSQPKQVEVTHREAKPEPENNSKDRDRASNENLFN